MIFNFLKTEFHKNVKKWENQKYIILKTNYWEIIFLLNCEVSARFWPQKALRVLPAETRLTVYRRPRVCACLRACVSVCLRSFLQACVRISSWRTIASIRLCICFFSVLTFVSACMCACLRVCMRPREYPAVDVAKMSGFWRGKWSLASSSLGAIPGQ